MSSTEEEVSEIKSNPTSLQDKLFNLRMKINQGRKANKEEVEEEYKRLSNPKYEQKQRYLQKLAEIEADDSNKSKNKNNKDDWLMQQTAEQAEYAAEKAKKKEENMSTFGWQAFTVEATHRAYEKRLKKLPTVNINKTTTSSNDTSSYLENNPLEYGKTSSTISQSNLEKLTKDIEEKEEARKNFSKRRMKYESTDVDYINDRNAAFNKKLKKSFDKYTVEIRQNLERGTAV